MSCYRTKKRIEIATMPRQSAAYHEQKPTHQSIASATSIRSMLLANDWKSVRQYVPGTTLTILQEYRETHSFITWQDFWPLLKYQLVITPTKQLQNIRGISEGIENRLQQAGIRATNFDEFLKHATTKRYSDSRIKRTSLQVLAKQTSPKENYIRLLGMSAIGQQYLRQVKKDITLPLISTASKASPTLLNNDIRATKLYSLAPTLENQFLRDFHTPPYRKKP
ncbi:nucleotidyltransferase family protein [Listeria rocourtiae]|uniref:nucleotidyltransferase family protein n=1 Tax=Listeria rocourtiae TaxID=647910 RepID=UPI0011EA5A44|nr:nucleotidyltransferase family protein [Listeria rocourtiae]